MSIYDSQIGDYLKRVQDGHVGIIIESEGNWGWRVQDAITGKKPLFTRNSSTVTATKEEYEAQLATKTVQTEPSSPVPSKRWLCLECGATYNGHECPACGGDDRIVNAGKDYDRSYLGN